MKGITLRRVKTDQIDGKPILSLPDKDEKVILLELSDKDRVFYDKIHNAGKRVFDSLRAQGSVLTQYTMILKAILLMRQACLHPSLAKFDEDEFIAGISTV
jgi:SNF2 family DNA or RNA helicase